MDPGHGETRKVNILRFLRSRIPRRFKALFRDPKPYLGQRYECPVCNTRLAYFNRLPDCDIEQMENHGYVHSMFASETSSLLHFSCPACGASDRERLYALYFRQLSNAERLKFIDFAPSAALSTFLKSLPLIEYRSADLFSALADDKVDLMDLCIYSSNTIDAFLCSHILEHVSDDRKAIAELFRILKPGGWGIVMVPIQLTLGDILEDKSHTSEADRWKHYGQNDHLRMYSKSGFIGRLEEAGFHVAQLGVDHFGTSKFLHYGITQRSVLYIAEKPKP